MQNQLIVSKFGGTSMGDVECMKRSATLAMKQNAKIVVVSATSGTTNDLIELAKTAEKGQFDQAMMIVEKIKNRHFKMANELEVSKNDLIFLESLTNELIDLTKGISLLKECSKKAFDKIQSFGERMSSFLFNQAMNQVLAHSNSKMKSNLFDVRKVLKTDEQFSKARPLTETILNLTEKELSYLKHTDQMIVTQGFIGETLNGETTTLGRGGSDYSAAILAEAFKADILEIWTDVAGIATTDPRIYNKAKPILEISFQEASELATFGAKVLHPATLLPAIRAKIPVFVGSSFKPEEGGTWVKETVDNPPLVRALAKRSKQVLVTLTTPEMLYSHGFLFNIFNIFNNHKVSVDAVTTSEISVSLTLDDSTLLNKNLIKDLEAFCEVKLEENLALVSLIGNNINHTSGLGQKIFSALNDVNVRMICLGASKHNFCFLVSEDEANKAIISIHEAFIN